MTGIDIAVLVAVVLLAAFAGWRIHENKRKGKGCCGQCSGCAASCSHRKYHEKKQHDSEGAAGNSETAG